MTNYQKPQPGERFRPNAALQSTLIDVANAWRANQLPSGPSDSADLSAASPVTVRVKNSTGSLLPRHSVLAITNTLRAASSPEWRNAIELIGAAPSAGYEGKFAILQAHAPENAPVDATLAGVAQVNINMQSADHKYAEIEPGRTDRLISAASGSAQIMWVAGTSGVQSGVVRLGNAPSTLWIRNDTAGARRRGEALEVTGVVSTPIDDASEVLKGDLRAIEAARGILLADVAVNGVAPFAMAGLVYAELDILDADHTHCYCKSSDANPQSNFGGPWRIVAKPSGTGNAQKSLITLGDPCYERKIKTDATLTAGSSAACSFYIDGVDVGSETVHFNWMENGVASVAINKEGLARWMDDEEKWVLVSAECA